MKCWTKPCCSLLAHDISCCYVKRSPSCAFTRIKTNKEFNIALSATVCQEKTKKLNFLSSNMRKKKAALSYR